ncbi:MAG TPA: YedE family putative selenium transporter [Clostridia bacterium]|nr:YedE family putative selenium transporter [Clostridia bacterium]
MNTKKGMIIAGSIVGILAALSVKLGNPGNMGICVACFIRDIAGSFGFHGVEKLYFIRPEIIGFILGAFAIAKSSKELHVTGGSAPFVRFFLGIFVMIGALVFLGCPLRMVLRLAGGDLNAILGILGFTAGIILGSEFLKKGFTLGRTYNQNVSNGYVFPIFGVVLLALLLIRPSFIGLNAKHAPIIYTLFVGLIVGVVAQKSRLCMVGGIRDAYLIQDFTLLIGFIAIIISAFIMNNLLGLFNLGFVNQPAAHTEGLWNFLGMFIAGYGSLLLGGCPLRQTILAAQGNVDSAITFMGLLVGAAISHNFGLAGSGAGVGINGKISIVIAFMFITYIAITNSSEIFSKN